MLRKLALTCALLCLLAVPSVAQVGSMTAPTTNNDFTWIWGYDTSSGQLRAIKVDTLGNLFAKPSVPAVTYTDNSGTTTAGAWLQVSAANANRQGFRLFNLSAATFYITYTATSSAPTGTPSTSSNSTPGAEPVGPGGAILSDAHDVPAGYIWIYCSTAVPYTEKEF